MPCDTYRKPQQTLQQRKDEIRKSIEQLEKMLVAKQVKVVVGPQGAITFTGSKLQEDRVTDACAYRRIMSMGSAFARAEIAKAEQLSGCTVNKQAVAMGVHSHDNGKTWHNGH